MSHCAKTSETGIFLCANDWAATVDQVVEDLLARRDQYRSSYYVVSNEEMEDFAPVVAKLAGHVPQASP